MSGAIDDTMRALREARAKSSSVLVSFSGGKDSLCVLDLCLRTFERVECFFMYFIPGLECIEAALDYARVRWDVKIHQYPHWGIGECLTAGTYCFHHWAGADVPDMRLRDIYDVVKADTGIPLIATGAKRTDSMWRKRTMAATVYDDVLWPLAEWHKSDVIAYLKVRGIPLPDSEKCNATGVGLAVPSLLWLHDKHPADFARLLEYFPLAEAVVWRRTFHGVVS